jgi:magnesium-transporting ATPase (P-type)
MSMFMVFVFVLGLLLMMQSNRIDSKLKSTCKKVRDANKILLILASVFMTASVSYMVCSFSCSSGSSSSYGSNVYLGFILVLGVALTVLGSMINGYSNGSGCSGVKSEVTYVISIGVLMTVSCIVYITYKGYKKVNPNYGDAKLINSSF